MAGSDGYLTADQVRFLAASLCAADIDQLRNLPQNPAIVWHGHPFSDINHGVIFELPNPWYLDLPANSEPVNIWDREDFIQPSRMNMWQWLEILAAEKTPVEVLDAGTGSGVRPKLLKDLLGDKIWTVGLGLENQNMPVDENAVRPMEVLPLNWTNRFDVVMSNYALGYTIFPLLAIKDLLRVLKPGKTAFLDIRPYYVTGGPNRAKIVANLLGITKADYWRIAKEQYVGLKNYETIKTTIESWGAGRQQFTVGKARLGDSSAYCVEVVKS